MSSGESDNDSDFGPIRTTSNRLWKSHKKSKSPRKTEELSTSTEEYTTNQLLKLHQQAEKDLRIGRIETALEKFYTCIDHYYTAVGQDTSNTEYSEYFVDTLKFLNENALHLIKEDKVGASLKILETCNEIASGKKYGAFPHIQSLTFNHIACCYRRLGKLETALKYLEKSVAALSGSEERENLGITHINFCAIYSQLRNHRKALEHAKHAVSDCSFDLIRFTDANGQQNNPAEHSKKVAMLAISYYNMGIEEDHCGNHENAKSAFAKAYELIEKTYGADDPFAKRFFAAYNEVRSKPKMQSLRSQSPKIVRENRHHMTMPIKDKRPVSLPRNLSNQQQRGAPLPNKDLSFSHQSPEKVYLDSRNRVVVAPPKKHVTIAHGIETRTLDETLNNSKDLNQSVNQSVNAVDLAEFSGRHKKVEKLPSIGTPQNRVNDSYEAKSQERNQGSSERLKGSNPKEKQKLQQLTNNFTPLKKETQEQFMEDKIEEERWQQKNEEIIEIEKAAGDNDSNPHTPDRDEDLKNNRKAFLMSLQKYQKPSEPKPKGTYSQFMNSQDFEENFKNPLNSYSKDFSRPGTDIRYQSMVRSSMKKPLKREDRAAVKVQKRIRGILVRLRYKKLLKTQKLVYIHRSTERYALRPEDPFDKQTFEVFVWLELLNEKILFNFFSIITKKLCLKGRLPYEMKERQTIRELKVNAKAFAQAHLQKVTIKDSTVIFGKVTQSDIDKNLKLLREDEEGNSPQKHGRSYETTMRATDWNSQPVRGDSNSPEKGQLTALHRLQNEAEKAKPIEMRIAKIEQENSRPTTPLDPKTEAVKPKAETSKPKADTQPKAQQVANNSPKTEAKPSKQTGQEVPKAETPKEKPKEVAEPKKEDPPKGKPKATVRIETPKSDAEVPKETKTELQKANTVAQESRSSPVKKEQKPVKQPTQEQVDLLQRSIRGYLGRKKSFYFESAYWEVLFSKNFRMNGRVLNLKVLQQRNKPTSKPTPPVHRIYGIDLTEEMLFNSLPFPSRAMNPKRVTLDKLQAVVDINVFTHVMELKPQYAVEAQPSNPDTSPTKAAEQKAAVNGTPQKATSSSKNTAERRPSGGKTVERRPSRDKAALQNTAQSQTKPKEVPTPKETEKAKEEAKSEQLKKTAPETRKQQSQRSVHSQDSKQEMKEKEVENKLVKQDSRRSNTSERAGDKLVAVEKAKDSETPKSQHQAQIQQTISKQYSQKSNDPEQKNPTLKTHQSEADESQKPTLTEQKSQKEEEKPQIENKQSHEEENTNQKPEIVTQNSSNTEKETSIKGAKEDSQDELTGNTEKETEEEDPTLLRKEDEAEERAEYQDPNLESTEIAKPVEKKPVKSVFKKAEGALTAIEAARRLQNFARRKAKERIYITSFPIIFPRQEINTYVFWISSMEKICVDIFQEKKKPQELHLELKDLGLNSVQELKRASDLDIALLPFISQQNERVVFKKAGEGKSSHLK